MKEPNWISYAPRAFITTFAAFSFVWADLSWMGINQEYLRILRPAVFGVVFILPLMHFYSVVRRWYKYNHYDASQFSIRNAEEGMPYGTAAIIAMALAVYIYDVDLIVSD